MSPRGAYLDYAATTPMRPEAIAAAAPFLREEFGNPSGGHERARAAKNALEEARERVAGALGRAPGDIVFTAGGTEADNLAVKGAAWSARERGAGRGIVTTAFEHKGVLAPCARLARDGFAVHEVNVSAAGLIDLDALGAVLSEDTVLVSVMLVNNEVGTVQPLDEVAALVRQRAPRAVLHTDAVQAVPWLDVARATACADLVSVSAHKFGGPKGVGVLVAPPHVGLVPLIEGGGQERGLRSGTVDVAGAVAAAAALDATTSDRAACNARVAPLRDRLADGLLALEGAFENGARAHKVAGNVHVGFAGVEAEALLVLLDREGVSASAGSSCSSGATEPSHVLVAMGRSREEAAASIRLSLGPESTPHDVDCGLEVVTNAVAALRTRGAAA